MRTRIPLLNRLINQKGAALLTVYFAAIAVTGVTSAAYALAFSEMRFVEREISRIRSTAAAEAGVQTALAQIGLNGYTGFINTSSIAVSDFQNVNGISVGSFTAALDYPNQADWVIVTASGSVNGELRGLEARVFLESNFSKYLVYANTSSFGSGTNAQYGYHDGENPEGVPSNEDDRAALYFTDDWTVSGANVHVYGDVHAEDQINADNTGTVHGDTYAGDFSQSITGIVTNDGIYGSTLTVQDGFDDDIDRDGNTTIDPDDYPDIHDLTSNGVGDSHAVETLVEIDHSFYSANNNIPSFAGSSDQTRYIQLQISDDGLTTKVVEYDAANYANEIATHSIPASAIVYVKGDLYVKGAVQGRVTFVSSDDIFMTDTVTYANGSSYADPNHSTAFMAKDKLYLLNPILEASGILYAENTNNHSKAFDAYYRYDIPTDSIVGDPGSKEYLRLFGNRVMNGSTNLSYYDDRIYGYDKNLRYFRPPGIPITPEVRTIREVNPTA